MIHVDVITKAGLKYIHTRQVGLSTSRGPCAISFAHIKSRSDNSSHIFLTEPVESHIFTNL